MNSAQKKQAIIILAFQSEVVAEVYSFAFEGLLSARIIFCPTVEAACIALKNHPESSMLIESDLTGGPLSLLFESQKYLAKRATIFVLGGDETLLPERAEKKNIHFLGKQPVLKDIVEIIDSLFKTNAAKEQYCKITLKSLFFRSDSLHCDVFLKLSDEKYVKVLHSTDRFSQEQFEKFQAKSVEFLYLHRADFIRLVDDLLSKVSELNQDPGKITVDGSLAISSAIFQTVHAAISSDGFTPQLRELTVKSVELAIGTIKKNPKLSELLEKLDENRHSYISWHSTALSFLTCKLATMLGWNSDSTFYKLSLASLLDLTLESDELAMIRTVGQLKASALDGLDRVAILTHPIDAAHLLTGFDEVPGEVAFIVEQHHEQQDSTGFPKGLEHKEISPISALFIISLDIVTTMYESPPKNFRMREFLSVRDTEKVYTKGNFGMVFRALVANGSEG